MLQAQGDSAAGGGSPLQGGGLAGSEGVSAAGDLEGIGIVGGSHHCREEGNGRVDEGAHIDQGASGDNVLRGPGRDRR